MILIFGATGNVGGALLRQLRTAHIPVRALTRDAAKAGFPAGVEVAQGDWSDPESLTAALSGVEALFLMRCGEEAEVLDRAKQAGVRRVVVLSTIAVETRPDSMIGRLHAEAERAAQNSGLEWTSLRPGQFMSNTRAWAAQLAHGDVVRTPFRDVGLAAVDPADIAAVARVALTEDGHDGAVHPLSGPAAITPVAQVAEIGRAIGRPLRHEEISAEQARAEMTAYMPADIVDATLDFLGSPKPAEVQVHDTVSAVTGRPARSFAEWARENAAAFRP
ncbi:NAD(P)H-binding protein [Streptomyces sp. NPDC059063]|uniref:NAD(P)H-binding protein n=1 Tax=unclassified Streptomyces TaxID=2593676 RepID=UPI003683DDB2